MPNVTDKLLDAGPDIFYDDSFRLVLEDHLELIKKNKHLETINIIPHLTYKFERDIYGLLNELNYPRNYHWIIMRVNGYHNPSELKSDVTQLLIPNFQQIENLRKVHVVRDSPF